MNIIYMIFTRVNTEKDQKTYELTHFNILPIY